MKFTKFTFTKEEADFIKMLMKRIVNCRSQKTCSELNLYELSIAERLLRLFEEDFDEKI